MLTAMQNFCYRSTAVAALMLLSASAHALPDSLTDQQRKDAVVSDNLSIPTPGELFAAIEKVAKPNWPGMLGKRVPRTYSNRAQLALNIGTYVADGFIAIQAEDAQQVKNIGRDIITLTKGLGVSANILSRGDSISDFAENNDWNGLDEELEATQNEVKLALAKQKDTNLIVLVSIGAWIRGAQAATEFIGKNYSEDAAALLRQPGVVDFLISQAGLLPERLRADAFVLQIKDGLVTVRELVDVEPGEPLTEEKVQQLNERLIGLLTIIAEEEPRTEKTGP